MYYTYSKKLSGYLLVFLFSLMTILPIASSLHADTFFFRDRPYNNYRSYYYNNNPPNYYYNTNPTYRSYYYDRPANYYNRGYYYYDRPTPPNNGYYNPYYYWGNGLGLSITL
jgi:hypothetical protein